MDLSRPQWISAKFYSPLKSSNLLYTSLNFCILLEYMCSYLSTGSSLFNLVHVYICFIVSFCPQTHSCFTFSGPIRQCRPGCCRVIVGQDWSICQHHPLEVDKLPCLVVLWWYCASCAWLCLSWPPPPIIYLYIIYLFIFQVLRIFRAPLPNAPMQQS